MRIIASRGSRTATVDQEQELDCAYVGAVDLAVKVEPGGQRHDGRLAVIH